MKQALLLLLILVCEIVHAQSDYSYDSLTHTQTWRFPNGNLERTYQWYDTGRAQYRHVIHYHYHGMKKEEYSERYGMKCDTFRWWNMRGTLSRMEIYSDSGYIAIDYDDSSTQILQRGEYRLLGMTPPGTIIEDSANHITYHSNDCEYACYVPTGTWSTFHPNGQLESTGKYLPYRFTGEQKFIDTSNGEGCYPQGTILLFYTYTDTLLREGTWMFFDTAGKNIREEYYEGGLLKSVVEIH